MSQNQVDSIAVGIEDTLFAQWWSSFTEYWDRSEELSHIAPLVQRIVDTDSRLVDVGCADMDLFRTNRLALPLSYVGIDSNATLTTLARKRFSHVTVEKGQGSALPLPPGYADLVLCLWVLHISDEIPEIVEESMRVCRPGGEVLLTVPAPDSPLYLHTYECVRRVFPTLILPHPNELLTRCLDAIRHALPRGSAKEVAFSGHVSLPSNPAARISPLLDFIAWLTSDEISLNEAIATSLEHADVFAEIPQHFKDNGFLVRVTAG